MPSEIASGQTTEGLPVAPSLGPSLAEARVPPERALVDGRVVFVCALSIVIALAAGFVALLGIPYLVLQRERGRIGRWRNLGCTAGTTWPKPGSARRRRIFPTTRPGALPVYRPDPPHAVRH